ncbi:MAG: hypothetical protein H7223_09320 [Pedobacter sp.]|nr:hypothetical protein [Pedobacter sp.]
MKNIKLLCLMIFATVIFSSCDRTEDPIYQKTTDNRYPTVVSNANFVTPSVPTAGYVKGTVLSVEFNFISFDSIKEIQFYEKIATADSILLKTTPYAPAFSKIKNCDTLVYSYTVPSAPASGTSIVFRGRVVNVNGLTKDRIFTYKIR